MAAAQADLHVAALNECLFLDDDDKEITFELSDGLERAHKAVLKAASDVFKTMFRHNMHEKASGVVKLPDVSRQVMRVFLRLLYTGRVDSSDWGGTEKAPHDREPALLKKVNMQIEGRRLTSSERSRGPHDFFSAAILAKAGAGDFEFVVRAEDWNGIALGIAPIGSSYHDLEEGSDSLSFEIEEGRLELGLDPSQSLEVPAGAELTIRFRSRALHCAVNGGDFVKADFGSWIFRNKVVYAPLVESYRVGKTVEIVRVSPSKGQCPVDVLVGATLLAKKYMVTKVLDMCTLVLKERLTAAKEQKDVSAFEELFVAAISSDMFSLRVAALQAAKDGFAELRAKHYKGSLHPAVSQDLQDVWPYMPAKRQKTTEHLS